MTNQDDYGWATQFPSVARRRPEDASPETAPAASVEYDLTGGKVLIAALRGALLMVPTLTLHRFWMITRLRRMIWNAVRVDGEPLEYTGRATELIFGFLVAVVVLAVILGGANLALVFAGLVGGFDLGLAFNASLPLLIPLGYYAQYRARRYLAARTRWRGLRFGMESGAVSYALHAVGHGLITLATLGILYPRQPVMLARRQQNATWYGNIRFQQDARWQPLIGPWLLAWALPLIIVLGAVQQNWTELLALQSAADSTPDDGDDPAVMEAIGLAMLNLSGAVFGALLLVWPLRRRYQAAAERALMAGLSLGPTRFESTLRTGTLLRIDVRAAFSYLGIAVVAGAVGAAIFMGIFTSIAASGVPPETYFQNPPASIFALGALGYAAFLVPLIAIGWLTGVHWPLAARIEALSLTGVVRLSDARQRDDDAAKEGGGFADALDVGAGF